jgi:Ca2+-binding EF-hand superfamily protein
MNRTTPYRRLLTAALCFTLPLATVACNASPEESELAVGEAAAFLSASEESGDIGAEAVADASSETLTAMSAEDVDLAADGRTPRFARQGLRMRNWAFWRVRWAFDENGDKVLSTEERTALVDAMEARCERLRQQALEKYDTNQDGTLDESERTAARQAIRAAWEQKRQELLAQYDTNANGTLELTERAQLREDRVAAARARRQELLAQYDTNKDGRLSPEEALPLRQEIQRRIIEGHGAN